MEDISILRLKRLINQLITRAPTLYLVNQWSMFIHSCTPVAPHPWESTGGQSPSSELPRMLKAKSLGQTSKLVAVENCAKLRPDSNFRDVATDVKFEPGETTVKHGETMV